MSRNVRVAGSLHEEGANRVVHRFALFTACSTAFLIFVGGLVTGNPRVDTDALILGPSFLLVLRAFGMVHREVAWQ